MKVRHVQGIPTLRGIKGIFEKFCLGKEGIRIFDDRGIFG